MKRKLKNTIPTNSMFLVAPAQSIGVVISSTLSIIISPIDSSPIYRDVSVAAGADFKSIKLPNADTVKRG